MYTFCSLPLLLFLPDYAWAACDAGDHTVLNGTFNMDADQTVEVILTYFGDDNFYINLETEDGIEVYTVKGSLWDVSYGVRESAGLGILYGVVLGGFPTDIESKLEISFSEIDGGWMVKWKKDSTPIVMSYHFRKPEDVRVLTICEVEMNTISTKPRVQLCSP